MESEQEPSAAENNCPGDLREALGAGAEEQEGLRSDYRFYCERCIALRDSVPALPDGGGYGEAAELIIYYFFQESQTIANLIF